MSLSRRALLLGSLGGVGGSLLWLSDRTTKPSPDSPGRLSISGQSFPIEYTSLTARMEPNRPAEWSLFLRAASTPARLPDFADQRIEPYSPHLTLERFPSAVGSLSELARARFSVPDGEKFCGGRLFPGDRCCLVYVKYHDSLKNSLVRFDGLEADRLRVAWTADCGYGAVHATAAVHFEGIWVAGVTEAAATALFHSRFDPRGLRPAGASEGGWWFTPG